MNIKPKDKLIIHELKKNSKIKIRDLSKKLNIPITTLHNRIKKLEQNNILTNYTVHIDYEKFGKPLEALVLITFSANTKDGGPIDQHALGKQILKIQGVERVSIVTGTEDMFAIIRAKDVHELGKIILSEIRALDGVERTQTKMIVENYYH